MSIFIPKGKNSVITITSTIGTRWGKTQALDPAPLRKVSSFSPFYATRMSTSSFCPFGPFLFAIQILPLLSFSSSLKIRGVTYSKIGHVQQASILEQSHHQDIQLYHLRS